MVIRYINYLLHHFLSKNSILVFGFSIFSTFFLSMYLLGGFFPYLDFIDGKERLVSIYHGLLVYINAFTFIFLYYYVRGGRNKQIELSFYKTSKDRFLFFFGDAFSFLYVLSHMFYLFIIQYVVELVLIGKPPFYLGIFIYMLLWVFLWYETIYISFGKVFAFLFSLVFLMLQLMTRNETRVLKFIPRVICDEHGLLSWNVPTSLLIVLFLFLVFLILLQTKKKEIKNEW